MNTLLLYVSAGLYNKPTEHITEEIKERLQLNIILFNSQKQNKTRQRTKTSLAHFENKRKLGQ